MPLTAGTMLLGLGFVVLGYLCGSIPFGLLVGKLKGIDIRQHGSGNIGATNVGAYWDDLCIPSPWTSPRVSSRRWRSGSWSIDGGYGLRRRAAALLWAAVAAACIPGHLFPVFLRFMARGGHLSAAPCWGCTRISRFRA